MAAQGDRGYITPAFIATVGLTLLLLVGAANQYAVHYARGVLQAAVEEGARQGRATGDPDRCAARVTAAVDALLGALATHVQPPSCAGGAVWTARSQATFPAWLPGLPPTAVTTSASVTDPGGGDP